ncbi:hypothetical protein GCM10020218_050450 [Dactylosporangium vinaceum]
MQLVRQILNMPTDLADRILCRSCDAVDDVALLERRRGISYSRRIKGSRWVKMVCFRKPRQIDLCSVSDVSRRGGVERITSMKKRSCGEDVDVQAEKATARQINTAVESTNGTNFRKGNMRKSNELLSAWCRDTCLGERVGRVCYVHDKIAV